MLVVDTQHITLLIERCVFMKNKKSMLLKISFCLSAILVLVFNYVSNRMFATGVRGWLLLSTNILVCLCMVVTLILGLILKRTQSRSKETKNDLE